MIVRRKANRVTIAVSPREWLDRVFRMRRVKRCAQDGPIANAMMHGAVERLHCRAGTLNAEGRVAAGLDAATGVEDVLAQHDVLTWDVLLIGATSIVTADHATVRRRSLRPVDPIVFERELFRWMVAS